MKLKSIKLHPFAGIRDKSFEFTDGLNILLGPNEAGKSTVYQAILNGLLTTTSLTAKQVGDVMGRFFPASGGDTIRVSIELLNADGKPLRIDKTWKKGNRQGSAKLYLADGTEITNEEEVQERIEELLPVSPATLRTILLADQSGLHRTIGEMEQEAGVRKELGDVLRQNLMETGGVSVDRFRELLDVRYDEYFKRWDRGQDYPEKNRGITNPYKTGTGRVLDAYYQKEQLRLNLEDAKRFEDELDRLNGELSDLTDQQAGLTEGFNKLEPLKKGIDQRQKLELKLGAETAKRKGLLEISQQWPVMEDRLKQLKPKQEKLREKIDALKKEQKLAQNKQQAEQLRTKLKKLEELRKKAEDARSELKAGQKIENDDVQALRELRSKQKNLKAQVEGARLTLRMRSEFERLIGFTETGKDEQELQLKPDTPVEKIASGGFTLKIDGVQVEVFSGEGDLEKIVKEVSSTEKELQALFKKLDVDSVQSAESLAELYRQKKQDLENAEHLYESELDGKSEDELRSELKDLGDPDKVRTLEEINDELVNTQTELNGLSGQADEAREKLEGWKKMYESVDDVILELAETSKSIKDFNAEIEKLPDVPEGFETADDFIERVDTLDLQIRDLDQQVNQKKIEKTKKENEAPDTSSEELAKMLEEAETDFERIHREAETLARVRERTLELLASMDADTYSGLEESFLKWLKQMAGDRFKTIEMDNDLPAAFNTDDGRPLTYELLSHGTKDIVALAWRFALTEHFMQGQTGFIILDDPMVDMDPDRRGSASKAIEEFSKEQQVLVMTCHPEHGNGLSGKEKVTEID